MKIMIKRAVNLILVATFVLIFHSCKESSKRISHDDSRLLYERSVNLYNSYIDSLKEVKDSAEYYRIIDNFDNELTKINFSLSPEADYYVNEEENDSLITLAKIYAKLRFQKEKELRTNSLEPIDSVSIDGNSTLNLTDTVKN